MTSTRPVSHSLHHRSKWLNPDQGQGSREIFGVEGGTGRTSERVAATSEPEPERPAVAPAVPVCSCAVPSSRGAAAYNRGFQGQNCCTSARASGSSSPFLEVIPSPISAVRIRSHFTILVLPTSSTRMAKSERNRTPIAVLGLSTLDVSRTPRQPPAGSRITRHPVRLVLGVSGHRGSGRRVGLRCRGSSSSSGYRCGNSCRGGTLPWRGELGVTGLGLHTRALIAQPAGRPIPLCGEHARPTQSGDHRAVHGPVQPHE